METRLLGFGASDSSFELWTYDAEPWGVLKGLRGCPPRERRHGDPDTICTTLKRQELSWQ